MNRLAVFAAVLAAYIFSGVVLHAAEPVQTQMGLNGDMEVDVLKARVDGEVLTVTVMFRNTSSEKSIVEFKWGDVFFINKAQDKKYHVLKDSKGSWVGSQNYYGGVRQSIKAGMKKLIWFKLPAPPASDAEINLTLPVAMPFDGLKVSR